MSAALENVQRYLDARDFIADDITLGHSQIGPTVTLADLREVVRMASEGVR